ncbi:MAG: hypothetical protein WCF59_11255 [Desulfobaccales bacterium]|jgi:hypothetical protein
MLKLTEFDPSDFQRWPYVEALAGTIVPMLAQVKIRPPDYRGLTATVVVDGNGIQVMIKGKTGNEKKAFSLDLYPFPLAVLVAKHLQEPLDPEVLTRLGFRRWE